MACYLCEICDNMKDGDYNSPTPYKQGLICEDCEQEREEMQDIQRIEQNYQERQRRELKHD